ncbi:hypothetical protein SAMN04487820_110106 [Actinopolyspora mzabensis]|uniref:Uncharacterized protein n=1 Tax=Actinopolyspora mzabensis TaxID=995066 RepID=A0A1G9DHU3_ACTMZ|nr:hypothetical protein [Actinopolyspora mzabensis]SDK63428.1 hypothetical protein SAMN04487820_110106 [Actinopolyspora mzabensis]
MSNRKLTKEVDFILEWDKAITENWADTDESVGLVKPIKPSHTASIINGETRTPHSPLGHTPEVKLDTPHWPLPSEAVSGGSLPEDEWADDPTIGHWAMATNPEDEAIRLLDHICVAHEGSALVVTDKRIAVVIESHLLKTKSKNENATNGSLINKALHLARPAQEATEKINSKDTDASISTLHEIEIKKVEKTQPLPLGKQIPKRRYYVVDFTDGSRFCHATE